MTKEEFINTIKKHTELRLKEYPYLRYGQTIFNEVAIRWNKAARDAQFNYGVDCFYDDNKVDEFLDVCWGIISEEFL